MTKAENRRRDGRGPVSLARWLAWLLAALLPALLPGVAAAVAGPVELRAGQFVLAEQSEPPGDEAPWQAQALPDRWRVSHPGAAGSGWYRLEFERPAEALAAVYLPQLGLNAEAFVNGVSVGSGGRFAEPLARNWNRPLLFLIPPGLLREGRNTLHVRLQGHAYTQAYLFPPWVGAERALRADYERAFFFHITVNQTASLLIAAIGVLALSLWWRRRRDTAYGYFGVSALLWAAQSTNLYLVEVPLATAQWEILVNASFQLFAALLLISLLRLIESGWRPLLRLLKFSLVASPLSLVGVPAGYYLALTSAWHFLTLLATAATLVLIVHAGVARHNREARLLMGALGLVLAFAAHDWLIHSQHFWQREARSGWLRDVYLLHYSAPLLYLAVGWVMTARYVRVLNEFEALNANLEERVRAEHRQLEASFARMRVLETDRAVAEERERIYRDLHDDVGAKLLSLVYRAGSAANADLARAALQDLRDVVSRTAADCFDLEAAAADWRVECALRLREAGLELDWRETGLQAGVVLTQPLAVDVGRILREAVSNVIRHAEARSVVVALELADAVLTLAVEDDGRGCSVAATSLAGRGLKNMALRAGRQGGALTLGPGSAGGCRLEARLRLAAPAGTPQI